jgi:hypothetical protein
MQIDFHHGVTYVLARLAGFGGAEAGIIAYSAQYVDDATNTGIVEFSNEMMYERIASAHKMIDFRNARALANHRVWLAFHFLPGNCGRSRGTPASEETKEEFIRRTTCLPDSPVARDMVRTVIERQDRSYALHRLGIAMHIYADTWAHQRFVGFMDRANAATDLESSIEVPKPSMKDRALDIAARLRDWVKGSFVGELFPLGHGAVLTHPDLPFLAWSYTNGLGERVERDNPREFGAAARALYVAMVRYRNRNPEQTVEVPEDIFAKIDHHLASIRSFDENQRHEQWLYLIRTGEFGFRDELDYIAKGVGSWKHHALGTTQEKDHWWQNWPWFRYEYRPYFLESNWKMFHDALQAHRLYVLNELLPEYGLCAA